MTETSAARAARAMVFPLALAQFIASYAATNMNVAISTIAEDLGTTVIGIQTTITLFTLTMASLMISGSKLTDIWYSNDYDLYIWGWGIEPDPNFQLSTYQTNQCGVWSDTCYSNPEYDQLFKEQQAAATVEEREQIIAEMQQILYDDRPEIVLWLNNSLAAYRNEWTGFQEQIGEGQDSGELLFQYGKHSILTIEPASGSGAGSAGEAGGGISPIVWVAIGAVVLIGGGVLVARSRRRTEEDDV